MSAVVALAAATMALGAVGCCDAAIATAADMRIKLQDAEKRELDDGDEISLPRPNELELVHARGVECSAREGGSGPMGRGHPISNLVVLPLSSTPFSRSSS